MPGLPGRGQLTQRSATAVFQALVHRTQRLHAAYGDVGQGRGDGKNQNGKEWSRIMKCDACSKAINTATDYYIAISECSEPMRDDDVDAVACSWACAANAAACAGAEKERWGNFIRSI